jgi:hypothetical protein
LSTQSAQAQQFPTGKAVSHLPGQANGFFEQSYVIEKDTNVNDLIEVLDGIPSGVLINKFTFSDKSEIVIQTIK